MMKVKLAKLLSLTSTFYIYTYLHLLYICICLFASSRGQQHGFLLMNQYSDTLNKTKSFQYSIPHIPVRTKQ